MNKRFFGRAVMFFGVCLIFAAAALHGYNQWDSMRAAESVSNAVYELVQIIPKETMYALYSHEETDRQAEMPTQEVDGISYLGMLEISALELELPVISSWSEAHAKTAPCLYTGSVYSDDVIICAHNYKSHFGNLPLLRTGDTVVFTDIEGNRFFYQVVELEVLDGTAIEQMEAGNWDLTLFTCTSGGKARFTVRCGKIQ